MTPADRERLIDDLVIVGGSLCSLAQSLTVEEWNTPSPAPGWDVRDQFAHLARFDGVAANALTEPQSFAQIRDALLAESDDVAEMVALPAPVAVTRPVWSTVAALWFDVVQTTADEVAFVTVATSWDV